MNRFISVPEKDCIDGQIPQKAINLAKIYSLEIRQSDEYSTIEIINEPKEKNLIFDDFFLRNRIWSMDYINEYITMSADCYIQICETKYAPRIKEKHSIKFRNRFICSGEQKLSLFVNGEEVMTTVLRDGNES